MKNKIIILIGISGSGKSTFAKDYVKNNKNSVIISRDTIRMALFGFNEETYNEYYKNDTTEREKIVTHFFNAQVWNALENGLDVVVDNTHLSTSYIYAYKQFGVKLEICIFNENIDVCIQRDFERVKCVGADVVNKQHKQFQKLLSSNFEEDIKNFNQEISDIFENCKKAEFDSEKLDCVVVDIDGCMAHTNGKRSPFDYSKVGVDDVDELLLYIIKVLDFDNLVIIFCTGRDEVCRTDTIKWFQKHKIPFDGLFMRKEGDKRKDNVVKPELWGEIQKEFNIKFIIEDRMRNVKVARKLGYVVHHVAEGNF